MAAEIRGEVKEEVEQWIAAGNRRPQLTAIIVGDDPASHTYIKNKMKATVATGVCKKSKSSHIYSFRTPKI